jgi:hypothetical protein
MFRSAPSATREGEVSDHATTTPARVLLTHDDLLWFKTSDDEEGRITLGLLELPFETIGVLVDDNGESLGLRLSRTEAHDLNRTLVAWLAGDTRTTTA